MPHDLQQDTASQRLSAAITDYCVGPHADYLNRHLQSICGIDLVPVLLQLRLHHLVFTTSLYSPHFDHRPNHLGVHPGQDNETTQAIFAVIEDKNVH